MAILVGLVFLLLSVWAMLPSAYFGLNWGEHVLTFLMGGGPILGIFIGLIAVFIGIADMKDKAEAKKEEEAEKAKATAPSNSGPAS
jgi:NhaP-type Na+/H+ or K+/H+ antiporter